ncbi:MAG TPA: hypothetical protein PKH58_01530 [Paludibacteraceae bacterium]|nr:hypothetical protein [Paludibacteraceae bacterium]
MKNIFQPVDFECLLHTFVVRDILIFNEPKSKQTSFNPQGWRTVASTEVVSRLSFEVSRGDHLFFFNFKSSVMRDTEDEANELMLENFDAIRDSHSRHRPELILSLFERNKPQLINDFLVEMDAKNKAYYFIIESGHFSAFSEYCLNPKKQKHNAAKI